MKSDAVLFVLAGLLLTTFLVGAYHFGAI